MKYTTLLLLLLFFGSIRVNGQIDSTFNELEKELQKEFASFLELNQEEFDQYVRENDKEFSDYLKKNWEEFKLFAGEKPDSAPKPAVIPKFIPPPVKPIPGGKEGKIQPKPDQPKPEVKPETKPEVKPETKPQPEDLTKITPVPPKPLPGGIEGKLGRKPIEVVPIPKKRPDIVPPPVPNVPVIQKSEPDNFAKGQASIDFYGTNLTFKFDPNILGSLPVEIHNTTIAAFWDRVCKVNYVHLINQLSDAKTQMNLNDWGYYQLVKKLSGKISSSKNYANLLSWYLLTKSGYRIRVSYAENDICLMFPSSNMIYGIKYFMIDNTRFYAPDFQHNQIYTYEKDFPGASKIFDLNVYSALNIGDQYAERPFKLSFKGREYSFSIKYNKNSIDFYKDFPLCELKTYFDASITPKAKESMLDALKPHLNGLSPSEAVDFLLNFVQNGFPYKTDPEQFNGAEKFFFPEEDFYYPYSDCDDRAVLFAYLVKELLNLKVIGVTYPGHASTAVHFPYEEAGDFIMYKNEKYMIADPTYIGAPFGLTMPGMVNAKAEVIELLNEQNQQDRLTAVWDNAMAAGGKQGDNVQNLVTDADGNSYITGYFSGTMDFGTSNLKAAGGKRDAFVAKFNSNGKLIWAIPGGCEGNAIACNVTLDKQGGIYISGTFEKSIAFGKIMMMANGDETCVFVAKFNADGRQIWLNQAKLEAGGTGDYIYAATFSPSGQYVETKSYPVDINFTDYGLSFDALNNVYYTATYSSTAGMKVDRITLGLGNEFNVASTLKSETDKQIENKCEKTIAGLFGAINLMRLNNVMISGKAVQEAFDKYNPNFRKVAPKVYEGLGKLNMIRNDQGIITVLTENQKPVVLDKLKITNETRLKVNLLPNGDARLDILNGVKVGKAIIWFKLNFVRLFRDSGNAIFDYDSDHSQIVMNMKKDMLF